MKRLFWLIVAVMLLLSVTATASEPCVGEAWYEGMEYNDYQLKQVLWCDEYITLREKPSVSADTVAQIPYGEWVIWESTHENYFAKVNWRGAEGYVLEGYLEERATALRVANCDEWISLREQPDKGAEAVAKLPLGMIMYSGISYDGFASVPLSGYGYGYAAEEYLQRADEGMGVKRYAADSREYSAIYRYATPSSDKIARVPAGEAVMCYSANNAGMVRVNYKNVWGFMRADQLDIVPEDNHILSATLSVSGFAGEFTVPDIESTQTITDPDVLAELNDLLAQAVPSEVGKCPMTANLTLEMDDGSRLSFIYPTDGCSALVGMDSRVYEIPYNINDRFWKIFRPVWK